MLCFYNSTHPQYSGKNHSQISLCVGSLVFKNNEKRIFDMSPYLDKKPYKKLKQWPLFMRAKVEYGTVVWPGNIDIAPETLWDYSKQA
jgi:hypothetical protein